MYVYRALYDILVRRDLLLQKSVYCTCSTKREDLVPNPNFTGLQTPYVLLRLCLSSVSLSPNKMLFLPAVLFSLAGGGYAHAVSPAYGNAWASSSLPWLLFLLLVTLRLDGDAGDAGPAFGRMSWLGIYFPLWVLILMLIGAHHVLPYVWKIEVFPEPYSIPGEKTGWLLRLVERLRGAGTAVFRKRKEEDAAKVDDNDDKEHFREGVETAVPL